MRKYWKTIVIGLLIATAIGAYYIQKTMAASSIDGSFSIDTISGNKDEIENLVIQASYQGGGMYNQMYITEEGSTNKMGDSYIGQMLGSYVPSILQNHIKEHRNFMRGKEFHPNQYFEDEKRLIYTAVLDNGEEVKDGDSLVFQIDILDKKTNDRSFFEVKAPSVVDSSWVNINDVIAENGKIKILATLYLMQGGEELHIYTIDESNTELELDSLITNSEPGNGGMNTIRLFNDFSMFHNEKYYLFSEKSLSQPEDGKEEAETKLNKIYLYHNSSNEVEEWKVPDELKAHMNLMVLHGEDIFIPVPSANGLYLNRYHIETNEWQEPLNFHFPSLSTKNKVVPFIQFTEGKVYIVNGVYDDYSLYIGDLSTGELLYEGKIVSENLKPFTGLYIEQVNRKVK